MVASLTAAFFFSLRIDEITIVSVLEFRVLPLLPCPKEKTWPVECRGAVTFFLLAPAPNPMRKRAPLELLSPSWRKMCSFGAACQNFDEILIIFESGHDFHFLFIYGVFTPLSLCDLSAEFPSNAATR